MYNDLWKYDIASGWWTWMGGSNTMNQAGVGTKGTISSNNIPGARTASMAAQILDTMYMFGGLATTPQTPYDDLWRLDLDLVSRCMTRMTCSSWMMEKSASSTANVPMDVASLESAVTLRVRESATHVRREVVNLQRASPVRMASSKHGSAAP